jgi:hypothetical protein
VIREWKALERFAPAPFFAVVPAPASSPQHGTGERSPAMIPGDYEHKYDDETWMRFKTQAASRWPELTEAEIEASRNDEELFLALLQHRYTLARNDAVEQLTEVQGLALG